MRIMTSVFDSPNKLLFGVESSKNVGEKLKELGVTKVLFIYDKGIKSAGIVDKIAEFVTASGIEIVTYDKVEPNPPDYSVNEAAELGLREQVNGILAIGGGSSLDTGKGVRILLSYPGPISNYYAKLDSAPLDEKIMKPLIVLPTTAGTGSEATPGGVITDSLTHIKRPIICGVSLGIIDPTLHVNLPPAITAATGFDTLCHAVEAVTSKRSNRISDVLGFEAITLVGKHLRTAVKDGANLEAREGMALAATLAGMSLRGPFGGIPHDLGSPLSSVYSIPHGNAVSLLLAEALSFIAEAAPDKVRVVAEALGARIPAEASSEEIGNIASDTVRALYRDVDMPSMKSYIPNKEEMLANIDKFYKPSVFSPRPLEKEDAIKILSNSYDKSYEKQPERI
ncbi:iron-containing alcohol dehydrogenase [Niallia endozanthoxylica]|uniref:Iron-containing alcohol dehydrogenase n=2 Tax=Niallia endozanthoxylica TaxID=2036016 RepID=A0A5J5HNQ0_9BACI|nr:iron-containing alcohol dehydrogenase [Niallia endozanthoxylica]